VGQRNRRLTEDKRIVKDPFLATPVETIKEENNEGSKLSLIDPPTTCM
jgi:hypothetical protein